LEHSPHNLVEEELILELRRAEGPYRRALALIQTTLPHPEPSAEEISGCLMRLQPLMQQTQAQEARLAPLREQWFQLQRKPGAELKQILHVHGQLLQTLIGRIDVLEARMKRLREEAIPALDSAIRHQQMHKAYHLSR
jgi:hypothetical protein